MLARSRAADLPIIRFGTEFPKFDRQQKVSLKGDRLKRMSAVTLLLIAGLTLVAAPHLQAQELMKSGQRETTITAQGKPLVSTRSFTPAEVKDRNSGPPVSVHPLKRLRATLHSQGFQTVLPFYLPPYAQG